LLKISEIKEIIDLVDKLNIKEFELEHEGTKLKLKKHVDHVQESNSIERNNNNIVSQSVRAEENNLFQIKSPMVGTFFKATAPGKAPYVKVGDKINVDTVVCIVEAMKLFNEIKAEVNGEIVEILAEEGQLIEYGQPLFLVK